MIEDGEISPDEGARLLRYALRDEHVLPHRGRAEHLRGLERAADPHPRDVTGALHRGLLAQEADRPRGGPVEPVDEVEDRRLARLG